ncbi:hypothetical protein ACOT81_03310 [Streptomyces sp. WI04-05B]|uniref:hypothetical protein n=1 Tax=Streptomyces TaxID=1883 RepID=UPI0039F6464C
MSSLDAGLYSTGRILHSMAKNGSAPQYAARTTPSGVPYGNIASLCLCTGLRDDARAVRRRSDGRASHECSFRPSVVSEAHSETRWQATLCPVPGSGLPGCSRGGSRQAGPFVPRAPVRQDGPVDGAVTVRAGSVLWRLDVAAGTADVASGPDPSGVGVRA